MVLRHGHQNVSVMYILKFLWVEDSSYRVLVEAGHLMQNRTATSTPVSFSQSNRCSHDSGPEPRALKVCVSPGIIVSL